MTLYLHSSVLFALLTYFLLTHPYTLSYLLTSFSLILTLCPTYLLLTHSSLLFVLLTYLSLTHSSFHFVLLTYLSLTHSSLHFILLTHIFHALFSSLSHCCNNPCSPLTNHHFNPFTHPSLHHLSLRHTPQNPPHTLHASPPAYLPSRHPCNCRIAWDLPA